MLRHGLRSTQKLQPQWRAFKTAAGQCCAKNYNSGSGSSSSLRQGKIMGKLFGDRMAGSKKRWFPTQDNSGANTNAAAFFKASQFGRSAAGGASGGGKGNTRRMTVLNKLFMKHITDLLATGEASEAILGRGLQVSRVKISPDFAGVNVYWQSSGSSDALADAQLEQELQRCSGRLRHELSQLTLMGEVPRITFVRDRSHSNLAQLEALLRNMDFGSPEGESDDKEDAQQRHSLVANTLKSEFYGKHRSQAAVETAQSVPQNDWPEMRFDVLGLDHREIMSRIHAKMRKTKLAWEQLQNPPLSPVTLDDMPLASVSTTASPASGVTTSLERINQKIAATDDDEAAHKFEQFLAQRRKSATMMPERRRFRRTSADWLSASDAELDEAAASVLSPQQRSRVYAEDFIDDDDVDHAQKLHREREDERNS